MVLYKVLDVNGRSYHGECGQWSLPNDGTPGDWMRPLHGSLKPYHYGYHVCRAEDLIHWLGPSIYVAEYRGPYHIGSIIDADNKLVVSQCRLLRKVNAWNDVTARLFAADCAEHVLHLFEQKHPNDDRPRNAITAARRFARGQISAGDLTKARNAARSAWTARAAARNAARAAWAAARNAGDAWDAARAAARAAWAAGDAAGAAWDAERSWQINRLFEYLKEADNA